MNRNELLSIICHVQRGKERRREEENCINFVLFKINRKRVLVFQPAAGDFHQFNFILLFFICATLSDRK